MCHIQYINGMYMYATDILYMDMDLKMTVRHEPTEGNFGAMLPVHATRRGRRCKTVEPCGKAYHSLLKSNFKRVCALPKH